MKKLSIILVVALTICFTTAYSLPNFWYSAVAYNAAGQVITTGPLAQVDVTITDGTNTASQTINNVPVDGFGVFNIFINSAGAVNMVAGTQITVKVNGVTVAGAPLTSIIYNGYHFGDYIDLDSEVTGILPDANVADDLTINGGTINNTVIGGTTPANGTFYDLTVTNDLDVQHYLFSSTSSVRITDDLTVYQTILQNSTAGSNTFNANTLFQGDVNIGSSFFNRNLFVEYGKTELNNGPSGETTTLRVNANGATSNAIVAVSSNAIDNDYATIFADKPAGGEGATAWFTGDDTDGGSILFVTNDASATPSINSYVAEIQSINSNAALLVANASGPAVKIVDGTEGAGKVLTSDASGNASWQTMSIMGDFTYDYGVASANGQTFSYLNGHRLTTYFLNGAGFNGLTLNLPSAANATDGDVFLLILSKSNSNAVSVNQTGGGLISSVLNGTHAFLFYSGTWHGQY